MTYKCISIDDAKKLMEAGDVSLVDIRDPNSFASGSIKDSVHVSDANVEAFLAQVEKEKPLIVVCYHGNSSQGAAAFFSSKGCKDVYSLNGGFVEWQQRGEAYVNLSCQGSSVRG